jgi:hypothetical protein
MVKKLTDPIHDMCISQGGNKMGSDQDADFWDRSTIMFIMFIVQYFLRTANTVLRHFSTSFPLLRTEADLLDEIQTKDLRVFLLAIHSHIIHLCLEISISSNSRNLK